MNKNKIVSWLKKYGTYCVAGFLAVAIGLTIVLTTGEANANKAEISSAKNPVVSVQANPVAVKMEFVSPMNNAQILKNFSNSELYFNDTLARWEFHDGIDMTSSDLSVLAACAGTVSEVTSSYADGTTVVITHADGFKSTYSSLTDDVLVEVGDKVEEGDKIGTAGTSSNNELNSGAHLHFELTKDNANIDPASFLDLEGK